MKILVLLAAVLILLCGCTGSSSIPQPTPTPETKPSPTPPAPSPPPEATPAQPPDLPRYEVTLLSFSGVVGGESTGKTHLYFSGEVRNDSGVEFEGIEVVITAYNKKNEVVATDKWHTLHWVIQPGETEPFGMQVTDYVSAVRYEVSFELFKPAIIDLSVKPGVSTEFLR